MLRAQWPAPARVRAFTTTRDDPGQSLPPFDRCNLGTRCGDDGATVEINRTMLIERCGLPAAPHWLRQVHSVGVASIDAGFGLSRTCSSEEPEADAAVTALAGTVLAVLTADCLPVLLCSSDGAEVAAVHAGWRGLASGIIEQTVAAMAHPGSSLMAWLGPAVGPKAYEIGAEVRECFLAMDACAASAFVATRPGHWLIDLYALARQRLASAGVAQVYGGGLCTISDPARFYSYRRDGATGRMASIIWLQP